MFTFVARDPLTRKSMAVNPLQPQTAEQRQLFAERQRVADERRAARQQQDSRPPSSVGKWSMQTSVRAALLCSAQLPDLDCLACEATSASLLQPP
jgi:hypothetical protein